MEHLLTGFFVKIILGLILITMILMIVNAVLSSRHASANWVAQNERRIRDRLRLYGYSLQPGYNGYYVISLTGKGGVKLSPAAVRRMYNRMMKLVRKNENPEKVIFRYVKRKN